VTGYLVDTNVISAEAPVARRTVPDAAKQRARTWLAAHADRLYLPSIAVAEIAGGIGKDDATGATRRAAALDAWLGLLIGRFSRRVLAFDHLAALHARPLAEAMWRAGVVVDFADLAIACIARTHDLTVATRNLRHFAPLGVATVDPFTA